MEGEAVPEGVPFISMDPAHNQLLDGEDQVRNRGVCLDFSHPISSTGVCETDAAMAASVAR
eukprot:COSAG02_NODE_32035_length_523_cov_0.863208_1_plen_61_part_00